MGGSSSPSQEEREGPETRPVGLEGDGAPLNEQPGGSRTVDSKVNAAAEVNAATAVNNLPDDEAKKDVVTDVVKNLPPEPTKDVAVAAVGSLPTDDTDNKKIIASEAVNALPNDVKKEVVTEAAKSLPPEEQGDISNSTRQPDQATTDRIWRIIISTFAAVLALSTIALLVSAFVNTSDSHIQIILTVVTTFAGILAGVISGRASTGGTRS